MFISWLDSRSYTHTVVVQFYSMRQCNFLRGVVPKNDFVQLKQKNPAAKISRSSTLLQLILIGLSLLWLLSYPDEGINNTVITLLDCPGDYEHFVNHHPQKT